MSKTITRPVVAAPGMILLGLRLPDMPGDEMLGTLRADPASAGIPARGTVSGYSRGQ